MKELILRYMVTLVAVLAINMFVGMASVWIMFFNGTSEQKMKIPAWVTPALFFMALCAASYALLTNNENHGLAAFALFVQIGLILLYILLNSQINDKDPDSNNGPGAII